MMDSGAESRAERRRGARNEKVSTCVHIIRLDGNGVPRKSPIHSIQNEIQRTPMIWRCPQVKVSHTAQLSHGRYTHTRLAVPYWSKYVVLRQRHRERSKVRLDRRGCLAQVGLLVLVRARSCPCDQRHQREALSLGESLSSLSLGTARSSLLGLRRGGGGHTCEPLATRPLR